MREELRQAVDTLMRPKAAHPAHVVQAWIEVQRSVMELPDAVALALLEKYEPARNVNADREEAPYARPHGPGSLA
jgi:hypothetical protein